MKKIIGAVLVAVCVLLVGCGQSAQEKAVAGDAELRAGAKALQEKTTFPNPEDFKKSEDEQRAKLLTPPVKKATP